MILQRWAEEFTAANPLGADTGRSIDLHLADTATAFFAGCHTLEAVALARFFAGGDPATAPLSRQAAAIAAITRHTECDDIHMASCITPGSVVIPVALAFANRTGRQQIDRAIASGYAVGMRLGTALGGTDALASGIWPTYFAAPMMAAATASVCLGLNTDATISALALAAAGAGGRAGRAAGTPSGRWLAFGEAVAKGCHAAEAAAAGFHGDANLLSTEWLTALAGSTAQPDALLAYSVQDAIRSVGLKPFVAARQTINAIHAFQTILARNGIDAGTIERIEVGVPSINAAMVARPAAPGDRLGTISNMAIQIAAAAIRPELLYDIERRGVPDTEIAAFAQRVHVVADPRLDALLPSVWAGRVKVSVGSREMVETCIATPGDDGSAAEQIIRQKLSAMTPRSYRQICAAQMEPGNDAARSAKRGALWLAMFDAMRAPV